VVTHVLYLDENGDHSMKFAGRQAPRPPELFMLCGCLLRTNEVRRLSDSVDALKASHLGRTDVVLMSRQIRKQEGPFTFPGDAAAREAFLAAITALVEQSKVTVFGSAIDKFRHWRRYGESAVSPYDLSLEFIMERVTICLCGKDARVQVVVESRGQREDRKLGGEFDRLLRDGSRYMTGARLRGCFLPGPAFHRKMENIAGLQLADLVAYPLFQRLRYPTSPNPAFDVVARKLHRCSSGVWGAGLKVFPAARASDYRL
jgi:hypothetical protein